VFFPLAVAFSLHFGRNPAPTPRKPMKPTRYFIDYDPDGTIALLARVRFDEAGIHGEYWENGSWIEHAPVADVLSDPSYSEEISSVKAHEIARSLGWDIGSDSGRSS
jgi:hypothetical protein